MGHKLFEISEYWVWMAKGSKRIKIHASGYLPLEVNFFDDYGIKVESKRTYELVLTLPIGYTPPAQVETVDEVSPPLSEAEMTASQMVEKGEDYYYGRNGVEKDYSEAVKWFRKSAEQGDTLGQCRLGYIYQYGYGVDKDYTEAVKWYRKAADQGSAWGQCNLGVMYRFGYGVKKNLNQARYWFESAAFQGYEQAKEALKKLNGK
jgi:tetratricopeptide (TPR) repeat protein